MSFQLRGTTDSPIRLLQAIVWPVLKLTRETGWSSRVFWTRVWRMKRPWTQAEIQALGTKPDADVGRLIGRPGKAVWAKRKALSIPDPPSLVRAWNESEDKIVLSRAIPEAAKFLDRTVMAVRIRRRKLIRNLSPGDAAFDPLSPLPERPIRVEARQFPENFLDGFCNRDSPPWTARLAPIANRLPQKPSRSRPVIAPRC